ncbi:MAG: hypothetical protein ACMUHM_08300 [Thermoplasmatota archaeon]
MSDIEKLRSSLIQALDEEEMVREEAYSQCRDLIRSCRRTISDLVNEKEVDLSDLRIEASKVIEGTGESGKPLLFVEDALAEYCEAEVLFSVLSGEEIRTPTELGISERAFVLGISDVVGELRRVTLNRLLRSDLQGAVSIYSKMEEIGQLVEGLVYPSGMIPLKKKQDAIRSILDRTGGELAIAMHSRGRINGMERGSDDG